MKRFLLALGCIALFACSRTELSEPLPVEDPCAGMIPAIHDHPDAQPVGALDATGYYLTEVNTTSDSCNEEFEYQPDSWQDVGIWMIAAVQDTYVWTSPLGFKLFSDDGSLFSLTVWRDEGESMYCLTELYEFSAPVEFTEFDMTASYTKHWIGTECFSWDREAEDYILKDFDCIYTFEFRATKQ